MGIAYLSTSVEFDAQWRTMLLRTGAGLVGLAALLDLPLLLTMNPPVPFYVLVGSVGIVVLSIAIIFFTSRGHTIPGAVVLGGCIMAFIAFTAPAQVLLYRSTGVALIIPILLVGIVGNFKLSLLFGLISFGLLLGKSIISGLPWNPYTFTSAFIIAITVGLLWLLQALIDAVNTRNQMLAEYAAQTEFLANERIRLARDIHDSIGHVLMTVNMQIEAARAHFERDPVAGQQALLVAQRYTKEAAADVRQSIATLRAPALETLSLPLPEAVEALAKTVRTTLLDVQVEVQGKPRTLTPQVTFALNRIVQEGLTNVRKHARATRVMVTLDYTASGRVRVVVHDNGAGSEALGSGYGLLGIQERVEVLTGTVTTTTSPGGGFTLTVDVPA